MIVQLLANPDAQLKQILLLYEPELIIIGLDQAELATNLSLIAAQSSLQSRDIPIEFMSIGAACRTFNILLSENRAVVMGVRFATARPNIAKLHWHCRRGMLELDLMLQRFLTDHVTQLHMQQLLSFEQLLMYNDVDLYAWLIEKRTLPHKDLFEIVKLIQMHN